MYRIVTHPGSAHKDDFLSTCVLLAHLDNAVVIRREPTREDLDDPQTFVVDAGLEYNPGRHNFDHHQDPGLPCGFHLVMQHLGYHEEAQAVYLWYQHMNRIDVGGAQRAAEHLGVDTEVLFTTSSPIEGYILSRFAAVETLQQGDELYSLMKDLGEDKLSLIERKVERLRQLGAEAEILPLKQIKVLFSPIEENPKLSLELYLRQLNDPEVLMAILPCNRGVGWELLRLGEHGLVDFRTLEGDPAIRFVHARGYMAKTHERLSRDEVLQLAAGAVCEQGNAWAI